MKLNEITKLSQFMEILDWDLDGHGLTITDLLDLQDAFIHRIVEGMDYKDLVTYAHEMLADYYSDMSDEEFTTAVKEVYPDFFEENQ